MTLRDLIARSGVAAEVHGPEGEQIVDLAYDHRRVRPGTLFFCVPGFTRDGHDFAGEALGSGAAGLVVERPLGTSAPEARVGSVRAAMGPVAAALHDDPTARLDVVGVTGTNGKTTTCFLVRSLLEAAGRQSGLLGTVTSIIGGEEREVTRTTPESVDLQRDFARMLAGGDVAVAMEVSSHALELGRVDAIHWSVALFTNLTQDHLDFHPTMEDYFLAKRRLFEAGPEHAVVNVDDPYGRRLADELPGAITFGVEHPADYRATGLRTDFAGTTFTAHTPDGEVELRTSLPGHFNVLNALGAVAAVRALGVPIDTIAEALPHAARVPGRFEPVDEGQEFAVLVDYAHTPDSLDNVLRAARPLTENRLLCVFGCGGDRDRGKRPQMGEIAARLADEVIVTSDNPRSEDPEAIIAEILAGIPRGEVESYVDRREAIRRAIGKARAGDVVVIAGKGHEQGQEFEGGRKVPFDDLEVAREALRG